MADTKNRKKKLSGESTEEVMVNETVEETTEAATADAPSGKAQKEQEAPVKSED